MAHNSIRVQELMKRINNQLHLVDFYQAQLHQAKASLRTVANSSPTVVPISVLPPEIMLRIFKFVIGAQPGIIGKGKDRLNIQSVSLRFPKYPDLLSHVCSHWRQIALASPALWTYIDLAHHDLLGQKLVARAKAYITRAHQSPLDIRVVDLFSPSVYAPPADIDDLNILLPATPIRSLELVTYHGFHESHFITLEHCFEYCAPGTLKQLSLRRANSQGDSNIFLGSNESPPDPNNASVQLYISEKRLEDLWAEINVLRLDGLYFRWTSKAYHNLIDLRLGSEFWGPTIHEAEIVEIMKSNPRLRIFHFHLSIVNPLPIDARVTPVHLNDLEVLNLKSMKREHLETFIRWIAPGARRLQLSIKSSASSQVQSFFARSNVTQLRISLPDASSLDHLLRLSPQICVLVIDQFGRGLRTGSLFGAFEAQSAPSPLKSSVLPETIRFEALYILRSQIESGALREIVEKHSIKKLVLWDCSLAQESTSEEYDTFTLAREFLGCQVASECLTHRDPDPTNDWDTPNGLYHWYM
ncbi:F-box-like domain containing protein [Ceratobasidium theobromae]|uniref:F-box-like domain containing protein n=1 Tax=Ceratobasidium theobromae TaxID=1582974 RepID=A0A5N5QG02_9AGAM|nr:F-box-like domain containing protein [Ceratobasidium theobromae]